MESGEPGLEQILELSREIAANGVCSLRVLEAIHCFTNAELDSEATGLLCSPDGSSQYQAYFPMRDNLREILENDEFVILPSSDKSVTRVGYMYRPTKKIVELWQFVEKPSDLDCSYAALIPAMDNGVDIDFSTIVTSEDETKHVSNEDLVYSTQRTNAAVMDALLQYLHKVPMPTGGKSHLAEVLKIKELVEAYGLAELKRDGQQQPKIANEPAGALERQIGRTLTWLQLGNRPSTQITKKRGKSKITANISAEGSVTMFTSHTDLGRDGRTAEIGTLHYRDGELIYTNEGGGETKNPILRTLAKEALEIPEIIVDTGLQEKIADIVRQSKTPAQVNQFVTELLKEFRQARKENGDNFDAIIDIGLIDAAHLSGGELFSMFSNVRACVIANPELDVFGNSLGLRECYVYGAKSAYKTTYARNGHSGADLELCVAENCEAAFSNVAAIKDCYAKNCESAFDNAGNLSGCIAEEAFYAFRNTRETKNCLAIDCVKAFPRSYCVDCIAEHCLYSFKAAHPERCESRNPVLSGSSFNFFYPRKSHKNKITGRIIGKRASKLRGKYQKIPYIDNRGEV